MGLLDKIISAPKTQIYDCCIILFQMKSCILLEPRLGHLKKKRRELVLTVARGDSDMSSSCIPSDVDIPDGFYIIHGKALTSVVSQINENRTCATEGCGGQLVCEKVVTSGLGGGIDIIWKCN